MGNSDEGAAYNYRKNKTEHNAEILKEIQNRIMREIWNITLTCTSLAFG